MKQIVLFACAILCMMSAACWQTNKPVIYIAGEINGRPALWQNGHATMLSTDNGNASEVTVDRGNIYVAGQTGGNAVLWKNGTAQVLGRGIAMGVCVSGRHVYVVGYTNKTSGSIPQWIPALWKDGVLERLSENAGSAYSVCVANDTVYIAGRIDIKGAILWKNGVGYKLGGRKSYAYSVRTQGNTVYTAGYAGENNVPTSYKALRWTNLSPQTLGKGVSFAVFATGNAVYVAGSSDYGDTLPKATIWINTTPQVLEERAAEGIFVAGNDVYLVGYSENKATLWWNGARQFLSNTASDAHSVFVDEGSHVF